MTTSAVCEKERLETMGVTARQIEADRAKDFKSAMRAVSDKKQFQNCRGQEK
jgi:hypothetical protein